MRANVVFSRLIHIRKGVVGMRLCLCLILFYDEVPRKFLFAGFSDHTLRVT